MSFRLDVVVFGGRKAEKRAQSPREQHLGREDTSRGQEQDGVNKSIEHQQGRGAYHGKMGDAMTSKVHEASCRMRED